MTFPVTKGQLIAVQPEGAPHNKDYDSLKSVVLEDDDIPNCQYPEQIYMHDGKATLDSDWTINVRPFELIKQSFLDEMQQDILSEMSENPCDVQKIAQMKKLMEFSKDWSEKQWLEYELDNLIYPQHDTVKQKLEFKINNWGE